MPRHLQSRIIHYWCDVSPHHQMNAIRMRHTFDAHRSSHPNAASTSAFNNNSTKIIIISLSLDNVHTHAHVQNVPCTHSHFIYYSHRIILMVCFTMICYRCITKCFYATVNMFYVSMYSTIIFWFLPLIRLYRKFS